MEHFPLVDRLHTDVLEAKYGEVHAEVLRHDDEVREALLNDRENVTRTYALTFFTEPNVSDEIREIDQIIREGGAIGKTFREFGYGIRKNVIDVYLLNTNLWLQSKFKVEEKQAKARLSEFLASKDNDNPVIYGTVMEAYTPDFRPPELNETDLAQISAPVALLEQLGVTRQKVWECIGENEWTAIENELSEAKKYTAEGLNYFHSLVDSYLNQHS